MYYMGIVKNMLSRPPHYYAAKIDAAARTLKTSFWNSMLAYRAVCCGTGMLVSSGLYFFTSGFPWLMLNVINVIHMSYLEPRETWGRNTKALWMSVISRREYVSHQHPCQVPNTCAWLVRTIHDGTIYDHLGKSFFHQPGLTQGVMKVTHCL